MKGFGPKTPIIRNCIMHRLFLGPSLTKEVVVTQHFAMIGSENGQAVFETTGILDEVTDLVVYEIDHAVISSVRTAHVVSVKANFPGIEVKTPRPFWSHQIRVPNQPMVGSGKSRWE